MRLARVAAFAALFGSVVSAQVPARQASASAGALEADLHYATGTDTWISTNKPAFVALFDLTRTGVTQLYPTFSAQAANPVGNEHRFVSLGNGVTGLFGAWGFLGASGIFYPASLFRNGTLGGGVGSWPHTLLLVASTSPLRVESPYSTNLRLNHDLIQRQFIDLQSETGVETIIDMIRPLDPDAEMAYDRVDAIPAREAQYALLGGFGAARPIGPWLINCAVWDYSQIQDFGTGLPVAPVCAVSYPAPPTKPATPPKDTTTTTITTPASMNRETGQPRRITDPEEIRRFIESRTSHGSDANGVNMVSGTSVGKQNSQNSQTPDKSTANVNRRQGDGAEVKPTTPRPTNTDRPAIRQQDHERAAPAPMPEPMAAPMAAPMVAPAPSQAPPIKP
jgi:hypothetical protein